MGNLTVSANDPSENAIVSSKYGVRWLLGVVIGLAIAGAIGWWLISRSNASAANKDATTPPLVTVVRPKLGEITAAVSLTGIISAQNDMPIGVDGEGGRIAEVLVEAGDRVKKGQLLARLDPFVAQSQVDAAAASLEELRASAAVAQAEYSRAERARDVFSVEDAERRHTTAITAQAKVKLAEAQLSEARTRLERTNVVAPSDGVVLTRTAEVGQIALPGTSVLFHLAKNAAIEMRGQVAEQDVTWLKIGQAVKVYLDGAPQTFIGHIWQIGAVIDPGTRQGSVRIALPYADPNLRPGAFARADVDVGTSRGVIVPQTAVLSDDAGTYAFIVDTDQRVVRRAVKVGGAHAEGLIVTAGLNDELRVIAIAGAFLRAGERVNVANDVSVATQAALSTP
jgi:HlyD family secretion protein